VFEDRRVVLDGFDDHVRDLGLMQIRCSAASLIEQAIHGDKGSSRGQCLRREDAMRRQTVMEAPRDEDGPVMFVQVWKSPSIERHTGMVPDQHRNSLRKSAGQGPAADRGVRPTYFLEI